MARRNIESAVRQRIATVNKQFREEVTIELRALGDTVESRYNEITDDWTHKVQFKRQVIVGTNYVELTNKPTGRNKQIFKWVDKGTKGPYAITIKDPKGYLHFQTGYDAKTAPIAKFNQGTGGRTGNWVKKKTIFHPGIAARKFSEKITNEILPDLRRAIENAFRRACRR